MPSSAISQIFLRRRRLRLFECARRDLQRELRPAPRRTIATAGLLDDLVAEDARPVGLDDDGGGPSRALLSPFAPDWSSINKRNVNNGVYIQSYSLKIVFLFSNQVGWLFSERPITAHYWRGRKHNIG